MRVVIRRGGDGLYFQMPENWTADSSQATDFGSSARALVFAAESGLHGVHVVIEFDDPRYNITLPILDKTPHWPFDSPGR